MIVVNEQNLLRSRDDYSSGSRAGENGRLRAAFFIDTLLVEAISFPRTPQTCWAFLNLTDSFLYAGMINKELTEIAKDNLSRVLGFFPRVDTVSAVVLAIDISALALLASNAPPLREMDGWSVFALLAVTLIGASLYNLYRGAFPRLQGSPLSLIYFREIAAREEQEFAKAFKEQNEDFYLNDLLSQIWRNSEILTQKFTHLNYAFTFLALSIGPWLIALFVFTSRNTESLLAK